MIPPIVICTTNGRCLSVLMESIAAYVPHEADVYLSAPADFRHGYHQAYRLINSASNFGTAYNAAVNAVFADDHESVVLCNDDVVLTPTTWESLMASIAVTTPATRGYVAARSDFARGRQNIRSRTGVDDHLHFLRFQGESTVERAHVIAPIFAYVEKRAWVDFPEIDWYSDDVQCWDMENNGFYHYIGSAYVHHVGAQTCGLDATRLTKDAAKWLRNNRPDAYKHFFS